ncbi:MAG: autoantigen p27 domain-containing protein [Clostridiales bacterium]|nr:autoantigen p27 domain-containing protein [Clostridiales bacterium]
MTISEKVAYLKGLAEGLDLDTEKSKEGKLISVMIGILEEVGLSLEDMEENALNLGEEIDALSDDLADVESIVYDEDEDDEDEEDGFEVECPNCDEPLFIGDDELAEGVVVCPNCDTRFSLDLSDDTVEGDDGEEE